MAEFYVAKNGNNSNAGTKDKPFLTIGKAISTSKAGDTVIVGDGTYTAENNNGDANQGLAPKNDTIIRAANKRKAIIDQTGTIAYGFFIGGRKNVTIDGFEIKNAKVIGINGGGAPCVGHVFKNNHIHHCKNNGISTSGADLLTITGNEVHHCANEGAQSGISVWKCLDQDGATPADGFRVRVTNNVSHHNRPDGGKTSDGNGIIVDQCFHFDPKYSGKILVSGNICYFNRGSGIRLMASKDVTCEYNTCWNNGQNLTPDAKDGWGGEIQNQWANNNIIRYNIGVAGRAPHGAWGNNGNEKVEYEPTQPGTGNTIQDNIFFAFDGGGGFTAGTVQNVTPSSFQSADGAKNKLNVNPKLKDPANGDFSTKEDSPARGAGKDGKDIGAWQSGDTDSGGGTPEPGPEPEPDLEERVTALEDAVADLDERVSALEVEASKGS